MFIKAKTVATLAILGVLMAAGLMFATGEAKAFPPQDDMGYFDGISRAERDNATKYWYVYCVVVLDSSPNEVGLKAAVFSARDDGFDNYSAVDIIRYTVINYCPRHLETIDRVVNGPVTHA